MDDHSSSHRGDSGIGQVAEILLSYAETKTTFQTPHVKTVPASSFADPRRWQLEMEAIFHRLPLMLALTAEMRAPGSYKAMDAMGKPVLLTRDKDGQVHAFLNVCAHRGAPLAEEGCGTKARLTCPYHAWTYGLDGRLIAVGGAETFGPVDKSTRGLTALPCVERAGMIFAVLTPGLTIDIDGFYGAMLDDFEQAGFADYTFLGSRVIEGANWKIAFDGYLEGYHFATLHPKTIHPRTLSNLTHYEAFGPHLRIGFAQTEIAAKLAQVPREQWGSQENNGFDFVRILFPNVSAFLAPEITQVAQLFPGPTVEQNRTVLSYVRRAPPKDDADRAEIAQMMDFLRDVTYGEDYVLGIKIQKGLESGALESVIFHEYVDWYLSGGATPAPVL
jgi:phenylpropionate dioxygenase-like ring-hydroxylating dioxygenase large terminal subunit